jgi:Tol biopolymer transport system component
MELVEGEGLDELIARGPVPVDDAIAIAVQIAEALEAAHEAGIVHRDLKPANVKIRPDGTVKVLDFGLAKAWEEDTGTDLSLSPTLTRHATAAGVILGTAAYMAPEQARGKPVDRRADIWSFGVVLWEMLTGRQLFDGDTVTDVLAAVLTREPDLDALPDGTPPTVHLLIARCLERDPRLRLQAVGEARISLAGRFEPEPPARADAAAPDRARLRWLTTAVAILLAAAVGWWLRQPPSVERTAPVAGAVIAPAGAAFDFELDRCGSISLSPDSRWLTFSARREDGESELWLREVGGTAARPLPGTAKASFPFWSPDSREVAFFANGRLMRIAVDAPAPSEVCAAPNGRSGGWNEDGVILFSPDSTSPIHRVAANGGRPVAVTELDKDAGETTHRWARFLPDGRHFVFTAGGHQELVSSATNAVWLGDLETGERVRLIEGRSNAVYASGSLLYTVDQTLVAHPFDPDHRRFTGDPIVLVTEVAGSSAYFVSDFDVSDTGVLAFRRGGAGDQLQLRWVDIENVSLGEPVGELAAISQVAFDPTGERVALVITDTESGTVDLWLHDLVRDVRTRLTFEGFGSVSGVVWSPDGRHVAYAAVPMDGSPEIQRLDLERATGPEVVVPSTSPTTYPVDWSVDGRQIVFIQNGDLFGYDVESANVQPIFDGPFRMIDAEISPDGRWVAYTSADETGRPTPFVSPFPDMGSRWQLDDDISYAVVWRDATTLVIVGDGSSFRACSFDLDDRGRPVIGRTERVGALPETIGGDIYPDGRRALAITIPDRSSDHPIQLLAGWPSRLEDR